MDFLLPRVGDFFSRDVASSEFSSRDHSGKGVDHGPKGEDWRPDVSKIKQMRLSPIRRARREAHEHPQDTLCNELGRT